MELHGKYTFFAEGCRGQLGASSKRSYKLRKDARRSTASA
jgi:flavin-dependent dehydrogenase